MTKHELQRRYPHASQSFLAANLDVDSPRKVAGMESDAGNVSLAKGKVQKGTPTRFLVRIESVRKRLLDEDGLCEKYHVDCCRYSGIISNDNPATTHIETTQRKCGPEEAEHTQILIYEIAP